MLEILRDHPWLIIILAALAVPILGILLGAWDSWLAGRNRYAAMKVLETYAAQGKDPPPEVLRAIGGRRWRDWREDWAPNAGSTEADDVARAEVRAEWREGSREFRRGMRRWRRNEPLRQWRMAIQLGALAGGFYVASLFANLPGTQKGFLLTAIILGAIAAASVLSAILTTLFRDK